MVRALLGDHPNVQFHYYARASEPATCDALSVQACLAPLDASAAGPVARRPRHEWHRTHSTGWRAFGQNPFAALSSAGLPAGPEDGPSGSGRWIRWGATESRGRVDILRQTVHRGGKTVTVITTSSASGCRKRSNWPRPCRKPAEPAARSRRGGSRSRATNELKSPASGRSRFRPVFEEVGRCRKAPSRMLASMRAAVRGWRLPRMTTNDA